MSSIVMDGTWLLHTNTPFGNSGRSPFEESKGFCENSLEFACDEVRGKATGIFLPLEKDEVLVKEGKRRESESNTCAVLASVRHFFPCRATGKLKREKEREA